MAANQFTDFVMTVWPRILGIQRVFHANMDVPHALGRPMLAAEVTSPYRFPGPRRVRTDSVTTVQSQLRGLPFMDAARLEMVRRQSLNMRARTIAPQPARVIR